MLLLHFASNIPNCFIVMKKESQTSVKTVRSIETFYALIIGIKLIDEIILNVIIPLSALKLNA